MVADMALASSDLPWPASPDMTTEYMLRTKAGAAINRCVLATTECYPLVSLRSVDSLSVYANESYLIRTQRIFDESCVGEEARPVGFGLLSHMVTSILSLRKSVESQCSSGSRAGFLMACGSFEGFTRSWMMACPPARAFQTGKRVPNSWCQSGTCVFPFVCSFGHV